MTELASSVRIASALAPALVLSAALLAGCRDHSQPPWDDHINVRVDNTTDEWVAIWVRHDDTLEWRAFGVVAPHAREFFYFTYNHYHQPAEARTLDGITIESVAKLEDGFHWNVDGYTHASDM